MPGLIRAGTGTNGENEADFTEISDVQSDTNEVDDALRSQSSSKLRFLDVFLYADKIFMFRARQIWR